jgi:hypothetical protein
LWQAFLLCVTPSSFSVLSASSRATVLRLNALDLRAWLRRRLQNPLLTEPIDPACFTISDAGIAALLNKLPWRADDADGTGL